MWCIILWAIHHGDRGLCCFTEFMHFLDSGNIDVVLYKHAYVHLAMYICKCIKPHYVQYSTVEPLNLDTLKSGRTV